MTELNDHNSLINRLKRRCIREPSRLIDEAISEIEFLRSRLDSIHTMTNPTIVHGDLGGLIPQPSAQD